MKDAASTSLLFASVIAGVGCGTSDAFITGIPSAGQAGPDVSSIGAGPTTPPPSLPGSAGSGTPLIAASAGTAAIFGALVFEAIRSTAIALTRRPVLSAALAFASCLPTRGHVLAFWW
jgi:hypothetical protein